MVHAYRNRDRNTRLAFMAIFGPFWLLAGLAMAGILFEQWPLTVLVSAPLFVLWASPIYTEFFLRFYEIQLSDDGACEFKAALRSKLIRAQQVISVERDDRGWRMNDEETDKTAVRFQGGSLVVVQPVDGFADFLARLKTLNPAINLAIDSVDTQPDSGTTDDRASATEEHATFLGRFVRSSLFPLLVIALLVYLWLEWWP
jgi:hypothetical protein